MPIAESTALGLDATWWTALGVIAALVIAVGGLFAPDMMRRMRAADLCIRQADVMRYSSSLDNDASFWVRVPVSNLGQGTAKNIEVILEAVSADNNLTARSLRNFIPVRLKWTHSQSVVCDRIAEGTFKLFDLGVLYSRGQWFTHPPFDQQPGWQFTSEANPDYSPLAIADGTISLQLAIVAESEPVKVERLELRFTRNESGITVVNASVRSKPLV